MVAIDDHRGSTRATGPGAALAALPAGAPGEVRALSVAAVAAVAVGLLLRTPPAPDTSFVEMDELMSSTSWVAPSDVLLPEHQFDIYQELPSLLESTESAGGSLL